MEKLLTAKQVSEILEVKPKTVYEWVSRGLVPHVKIGRLVRFKKAEIFHWLESKTLRPQSPPTGRGKQSRSTPLQKEFPL